MGKIRPAAQRQLEALRWNVPLQARVEDLSVGQQQRVEITKALLAIERSNGGGAHEGTLILDEPTAVLTPQEAGELFAALETLRKAGTGIVFISHKLGEVQRICDEVTILRRGKVVLTAPTSTLTATQMAEKMVGAAIEMPRLARTERTGEGNALLELRGVSAGMVKNASLQIRPGEIVGIAGVDGNGQSDLVQAIIGGARLSAGRILVDGQDATERSIRWRVDRIAYIAEDRHRQAVVLPLSIRDNLLLKDYRRRPYSARGLLRFSAWRSHSLDLVNRFDVRTPSVATPVGRLSGGNQQKVVLARELYDVDKRTVIAVNPTRGLDVGATAFVMKQLLAARERTGAGVLLVHSDLDELLAISDRVLVIFNGELHWKARGRTPRRRTRSDKMMMGVVDAGGGRREILAPFPGRPRGNRSRNQRSRHRRDDRIVGSRLPRPRHRDRVDSWSDWNTIRSRRSSQKRLSAHLHRARRRSRLSLRRLQHRRRGPVQPRSHCRRDRGNAPVSTHAPRSSLDRQSQ